MQETHITSQLSLVKEKPKKQLPTVQNCELVLTWMQANPGATFSMLYYNCHHCHHCHHLTKNQVKDVIDFLANHQRPDVLAHLQIIRHVETSDSPGSSTKSPESPTKDWTQMMRRVTKFHFTPAEATPAEATPAEATPAEA